MFRNIKSLNFPIHDDILNSVKGMNCTAKNYEDVLTRFQKKSSLSMQGAFNSLIIVLMHSATFT